MIFDIAIGRVPRPIRFGFVGGVCAALQLGALYGLVHAGLERHWANSLAFLLSTQINFCLSAAITWRDRRDTGRGTASTAARLASYNAMALVALLVNQGAFALAALTADYLLASALGILAAAAINYLVSGRLVFGTARAARSGLTVAAQR